MKITCNRICPTFWAPTRSRCQQPPGTALTACWGMSGMSCSSSRYEYCMPTSYRPGLMPWPKHVRACVILLLQCTLQFGRSLQSGICLLGQGCTWALQSFELCSGAPRQCKGLAIVASAPIPNRTTLEGAQLPCVQPRCNI